MRDNILITSDRFAAVNWQPRRPSGDPLPRINEMMDPLISTADCQLPTEATVAPPPPSLPLSMGASLVIDSGQAIRVATRFHGTI